ncbi:hypothetical protein C8J57DRAFT_1355889 [Mycena rebaudengoi]|nr:hypothetical protein C8J57DRAFT_1355889 [Mycena rebaudengoi]
MPRVDTSDARREQRDLRRRASHPNRSSPIRTPHTVKTESISSVIPSSKKTPKTQVSPQRSWRHPDELAYIRSRGSTWDDMAIVSFLTSNALSIPPRRTGKGSKDPERGGQDGKVVVLPRAYRIPLLWVAKFQWTSLALVLSANAEIRKREWDSVKWEILHIARLCEGLLAAARREMGVGATGGAGGMARDWRYPPFDRALTRYWYHWLVMRDEFVRDFWREFGEEEYKIDVLERGWGQWVLKGHKGFALTKAEVVDGITAAKFMHGLIVDKENRTFEWVGETDTEAAVEQEQQEASPGAPSQVPPPIAIPGDDVSMPPVLSFQRPKYFF